LPSKAAWGFTGRLTATAVLSFGNDSSDGLAAGQQRCAKTCALACDQNPACYAWAFDLWRHSADCRHYGKGLDSSLTSSIATGSYWTGGACARPDQPRQACAATSDCAAGYYCLSDGYCYNDCRAGNFRYNNNICALAGDAYYCGSDNKCTSGCAAAPPTVSAPASPPPRDADPTSGEDSPASDDYVAPAPG
jgi:hypothetical protein